MGCTVAEALWNQGTQSSLYPLLIGDPLAGIAGFFSQGDFMTRTTAAAIGLLLSAGMLLTGWNLAREIREGLRELQVTVIVQADPGSVERLTRAVESLSAALPTSSTTFRVKLERSVTIFQDLSEEDAPPR